MGKALRGTFITPTYILFYIGSPKGTPPFLRGEDFLRFFPEPFPGAITTAAAITAITTTTTPPIIITTATTAINGTPIKVKVFPFRETF